MTLRTWLDDRTPAAPPRLAERIEAALGARCDATEARAADACLEAADELLRELLRVPSPGRESALDLLAADALVTYAFEAAARDPSSLSHRANEAMRRLSAAAR